MAAVRIIPLYGGCANLREVEIWRAVRRLERDYRAVYPYQVAMVVYLCEQSARRYMADMARRGVLDRLGERRGYRTRRDVKRAA